MPRHVWKAWQSSFAHVPAKTSSSPLCWSLPVLVWRTSRSLQTHTPSAGSSCRGIACRLCLMLAHRLIKRNVYLYLSIYIYIYTYRYRYTHIIEGSLEVKLLTIWTDEKQSRAEAERRERSEERRVEEKE